MRIVQLVYEDNGQLYNYQFRNPVEARAISEIIMGNIQVSWEDLDKNIKQHDEKYPKKFSYPKDSLEEAKEQAIKELGGANEDRLGKGSSK
jgi:hypothetical protein